MTSIGSILHLALGLYLLWFLLFFCFRSYRLDNVRDELFQVRNELFDYAATGAISFDDPAYWMLRQRLNGLLRFAHTLTFVRIALTLIAASLLPEAKGKIRVASERWRRALEHTTPGVREKLWAFDRRAGGVIAKHVVMGSPVLICTLLPYIAIRTLAAFVAGKELNPLEEARQNLKMEAVQDQVAEQQSVDLEELACATA